MGVNLTSIIPRKEISFESLINKKVAVDASNMLYQFIASIRQPDGTPLQDSEGNVTSHLVGSFYRLTNLMKNGVKLVVCFDGKMPELKYGEIESREQRKVIAEERLSKAETEEESYKYSKQTSRLTKEMKEEAKELISALGIPVIQAPSECDAQIAFMCRQGDVDFVASSDYDCLLFGAPKMITNLTLSQRKKHPSGATIKINPELIILKEVLSELKLKQEQLIAVAMLCGTDYNNGVPGIGPKTALKLVKQHPKIENLFKEIKAEFDWKKVYEIYTKMPVFKTYKLKWIEPDEKEIKKILVKKHDFSEERVDNTLKKIEETKEQRKQSGLSEWIK